MEIAKVIHEIRRNPTKAITYGSLVGGGILLAVLLVTMLSAWGVFGGGDKTDDIAVPLNQEISLYGGALKVWVTGVQKRPLSTFGPVSDDDIQQRLVALQVDIKIQYVGSSWTGKERPQSVGDLLRTAPPTTMQVSGISKQTGAPGVWLNLVQVQNAETDGGIYDMQARPVPEDAATISGSFVFKVPIDAADMALILADYGEGRQANRSGMPRRIYRVPLDRGTGE